MLPLPSLSEEMWKIRGKVQDCDNTLNILANMMEAIYDGVNLPCKEQLVVFNLISRICKYTTSKMSHRRGKTLKDIYGPDRIGPLLMV